MSFTNLGLSENVLRGIPDTVYTAPTPIQAQAIPVATTGRDVIGCAQTGIGKTVAFVLPILSGLKGNHYSRKHRSLRALIVTPTRELALQIDESVRTYGTYVSLFSQTIYGRVARLRR